MPTEGDAVRDAYVASLEAVLRDVADDPMVPDYFRTCALLALGAGEVSRIPDGVRLSPYEVKFTRWPTPGGEWHLIGPAEKLVPGTVIEVLRFNGPRRPSEPVLVAVGFVVAERTVIHRDEGPTRYVVARVSKAVKEVG